MRIVLLLHLLLRFSGSDASYDLGSGSQIFERGVGIESGPQDVYGAGSSEITCSMFQRIVNTEATSGQRGQVLSLDDNELMWAFTMEYEWNVTRARQAGIEGQRRRLAKSFGMSPFITCDMEYGKSGEDCKMSVQSWAGSDVLPMYNKVDMTCFIVKSVPSSASTLPSGQVAVPLAPEMKMAEGMLDTVTSDPSVSSLEASFCPGEVNSLEEANALGTSILDDARGESRAARIASFLRSRLQSFNPLHEFWNDNLAGSKNATFCDDVIDTLIPAVSMMGILVRVETPLSNENIARCILELAIDLSLQPEICFINAARNIDILNTLASGIVQSGSSSFKPFYDTGLEGSGQVIAISDTGVDVNNCYFRDSSKTIIKAKSNYSDFSARKIIQYYTYVDSSDILDGHGTHVCGSALGAAIGTGSPGQAAGVAFRAKLAFFDIGNSQGSLTKATPATLFTPGYQAGARIHSSSWGVPLLNSYTSYEYAVDDFLYKNPDLLFVIAAGNDGVGNIFGTVMSPSTCKNGLSVGATQNARPHINNNQLGPDYVTRFSSRGPTKDGRRKPEVLAPGQYLLSARAVPNVPGVCDNTATSGTRYSAGTSMATPIVSGTAALVRQYFVEGWHRTGQADPTIGFSPRSSLVKAVLINGADAVLASQDEKTGKIYSSVPYDHIQGFGRLNLLKSLPLSAKNKIKAIFVNKRTLKQGKADLFQIIISNRCQAPLSATLVWTDPPGVPNCNKGCVLNDLDLSLTLVNNSKTYFPNGLSGPDRVNNAERIRIDRPTVSSVYNIQVKAYNLLQAQDYSLVVTGCFYRNKLNSSINSPNSAAAAPSTTTTAVATCNDTSTLIQTIDTSRQSCEWLQANLANYDHLCNLVNVAITCPSTCNMCQVMQLLETGSIGSIDADLEGQVRWYGIQFDVFAKKNVVLQNLDLHLYRGNNTLYQIQVLLRLASSSSTTPFQLVCEGTVVGQGLGLLSTLPRSACQGGYVMSANTTYTLYVTTMDQQPDLVMTKFTQALNVSVITDEVENSDLQIQSGVAVTFSSQSKFESYAWNGVLHYVTTTMASVETTAPSSLVTSATIMECIDSAEVVWISDMVGARDCVWLAQNIAQFGYLCQQAAPAWACPATCGACSP